MCMYACNMMMMMASLAYAPEVFFLCKSKQATPTETAIATAIAIAIHYKILYRLMYEKLQ